MILLDADVVLIDRKYVTDPRHARNRTAIARMLADGHPLGMVAHGVLEVVGVMSHGTPAADVPLIPAALRTVYGLTIFPDPVSEPEYARTDFDELVRQMSLKMGLGDAVAAIQVARFAPPVDTFVTWNAKHFRGKMAVPVLTPDEWLTQQTPPAGPTP